MSDKYVLKSKDGTLGKWKLDKNGMPVPHVFDTREVAEKAARTMKKEFDIIYKVIKAPRELL